MNTVLRPMILMAMLALAACAGSSNRPGSNPMAEPGLCSIEARVENWRGLGSCPQTPSGTAPQTAETMKAQCYNTLGGVECYPDAALDSQRATVK